ncbi:MAG: hypothetical protein IJL74_02585 [Bacilli bacterium]|nr:hypothetical protein [Bacilli bacterium]
MSQNKYNNHTLFQIVKHMKYNPYYAFSKLEDYLYEYHNDYYAYTYYVKLLIDLGNLEEAESMISFLETTFPKQIEDNLIFAKVRLLMFTGRFEEAFDLYNNYKEMLDSNGSAIIAIETMYEKMVKDNFFEGPSGSYLRNQIVDYDYDAFLNHIQKHTADYNSSLDKPNPVIFSPDFPLDKVFEEINKIIPNDKCTYFSVYYNFYVFKYDGNGRINNKLANYFRVVTLHNTNEIITMYPMDHGALLPYIDLNYLKEEKPSVKVMSRVDKFYKKYGDVSYK